MTKAQQDAISALRTAAFMLEDWHKEALDRGIIDELSFNNLQHNVRQFYEIADRAEEGA